MAEVFGAVAGGISIAPIALELAKSVKRLKDFCHEVKNAPEDIQDLVDEMDDMSAVLAQLTAGNLHFATNGGQTLQTCLMHYSRANGRISAVVTELQGSLAAHRRRTSVAFPLNRAKLKDLAQKLERAKSSLLLALQTYSISVAQAQAADTQQRFQDLTVLLQTSTYSLEQSHKTLSSGQSLLLQRVVHTQQLRIDNPMPDKIAPGSKLSPTQVSQLWNFCVDQVTLGWSRFFRTYRVLSRDAPGFDVCQTGDLKGLQRLLCSQQLSINDRDRRGTTLFHVSGDYVPETGRLMT